MRRRRVDWDEELRKTERIRRRGFALTGLSFAVALGVIVGVGRLGGVNVALPRKVLALAGLALGVLLFRVVLRRRQRLRQESEEGEI